MARQVLATSVGHVEVVTAEGRLKELNFTRAQTTRPIRTDPIVRELAEYFRGRRKDLRDIPIDLGDVTDFERSVYEAIRLVPFGKVVTYRQVARAIGRPNAQRAVGQALSKNPIAVVVPCHRVVASDGLGGFSGGLSYKRRLLRLEGVLP